MFRYAAVSAWVCLGILLLGGIAGCGKATLVANDTIVLDGQPASLDACVGSEDLFNLRNDIHKVSVTFRVDGRQIGQDMVDENGRAFVIYRGAAGNPSTFHAASEVRSQVLGEDGRIFYWRHDRVILAIDVDYCIVKTNYVRLLFGKHIPVSPPFSGAREVLAELSKDYQLLYLTARPRPMLDRTREWLDYYGFPPSPVIVSDHFRDVLHQPEWKRDILKQLQLQYPSLLVSVGNRKLDIESALQSNILPLIVQSTEMDAKDEPGNVIIEDWQAMSEFFRVNRQTLIDPARLNRAIRQGATFLQPGADREGRYQYQPKHVGTLSRTITGSAGMSMGE